MLSSFLLALREGTEAALVIGIVLGALRKIRRPDCARVAWLGVLTAVAASVLAAVALRALGLSFTGRAEPIFEGSTLFVAAGLLTWMIVWMARQSRKLKVGLEADVRQAVCVPGRRGVFALMFVAVAREGLELAIFLTASAFDAGTAQTIGGSLLGLAAAAFFGYLLFTCTWRLDLRWFFRLTGALSLLFAAGLVAKGVHALGRAGFLATRRGMGGGFRLALPPEKTSLGAVIRLTQANDAMVDCQDGPATLCRIFPACRLRQALKEASGAFFAVLDCYSLASLVKPRAELKELLKI
jgi:high-affinity iron transporter